MEDLKAFIESTVKKNYLNDKKYTLLSQLGNSINKDQYLKKQLEGSKLMTYISNNLSGSIKIESSLNNPIIKFLLPKDADTWNAPNVLEYDQSVPNFHRAIWTAFIKDIMPGKNRYVKIEHPIQFEDSDTHPSQWKDKFFEIPSNLISLEMPRNKILISEKIKEWAKTNAIPIELLIWRAPEFTEEDNNPTRLVKNGRRSLLEHFLTTLNDDDLRRIVMPLDVIKKIHLNKF